VRKRRFTIAAAAAAGVFLAVSAVYLAKLGWDRVFPGLSWGLVEFRLERARVEIPVSSVRSQIEARLSARLGESWTSADSRRFLEDLKSRYPYLKEPEFSRNYLTGSLLLRAGVETIVAPVSSGGGDWFLGESGRLFSAVYPEAVPGGITANLPSSGRSFPSVSAFLSRLNALSGLFGSHPNSLACSGAGDSCRLFLDDGTEVLWGEFEFTRAKILRLNEILKNSASRLKGPYKVDLRYFEDGQAVVSSL
jgi:hypothetical protein